MSKVLVSIAAALAISSLSAASDLAGKILNVGLATPAVSLNRSRPNLVQI